MNFDDDEDAFVLATPEELGMDSPRETSFSPDDGMLLNVSLDSTSTFRPVSERDMNHDPHNVERDTFVSHPISARGATLAVPTHFRLQPRFNVCRVKLI
jgi:hypothetical protein